MLITAHRPTTIQHLHNLKFTLVNKAIHNTLCMLSVVYDVIFYMCTCSLIPRPQTTVNSLGMS